MNNYNLTSVHNFNLAHPEYYPLSKRDFEKFLLSNLPKLLGACKNIQRDWEKISVFAQTIFTEHLLPKLEIAFNENKLYGYYFIKAARFFKKETTDPEKIKLELMNFLQQYLDAHRQNNQDLVIKMHRQLYKLSYWIESIQGELKNTLEPFIKKTLVTSDNQQFDINPLKWFANSPCLYQTLFESHPNLSLSENTMQILAEHISGINMHRQRSFPANWVPRHPLPQTLDECLAFYKDIAPLEIPYLTQDLSGIIATLIKEDTILKILDFALSYKVHATELLQECFTYIMDHSGLWLTQFHDDDFFQVQLNSKNDNNTIVLEFLSQCIGIFNINQVTPLNPLKKICFTNVHTLNFCPKSTLLPEVLPQMFPRATTCILHHPLHTKKETAEFCWDSVQVLTIVEPITETNLKYFKTLFPNLQMISSYDQKDLAEQNDVIFVPTTFKDHTIDFSKLSPKLITDDVVTFLVRQFPSTIKLNLSNSTQITDQGVKAIAQHCPNLTELDLTGCNKLTDESIKLIAPNCPNLTYLSLGNLNLLTDASLKLIAQHYPNLTKLSLRNCNLITHASIKLIAQNCKNLTKLGLRNCNLLIDESIKLLAQNCTKLTILGLRNLNLLTDEPIMLIAQNCTNLTHLNLSDCPLLTKKTWETLKNLQSLKLLSLENCTISPEELEQLRQALPNCSIECILDDPTLSVNKKSKIEQENI